MNELSDLYFIKTFFVNNFTEAVEEYSKLLAAYSLDQSEDNKNAIKEFLANVIVNNQDKECFKDVDEQLVEQLSTFRDSLTRDEISLTRDEISQRKECIDDSVNVDQARHDEESKDNSAEPADIKR